MIHFYLCTIPVSLSESIQGIRCRWANKIKMTIKQTLELRINYFKADEGKNVGESVKVVEISKEDPRYNQIPIITAEIKKKYDKAFFFTWQIKRKYSKEELDTATLLHLKIKAVLL